MHTHECTCKHTHTRTHMHTYTHGNETDKRRNGIQTNALYIKKNW